MKSLRLLSLVLALALMLALVACNGDEEAAEATIEPAATVAEVETVTEAEARARGSRRWPSAPGLTDRAVA